MNKLIFGSITVIILTAALFIYLKFFASPVVQPQPTPTPVVQPTPIPTPTPVTPSPQPTPTPTVQTIQISTASGVATVKDFKTDPSTILDQNNPGHYHLAGGVGAAQVGASYTIVYNESDQSFTIGLWREPIKAVRQAAEQDLLQKLGITQNVACSLRYMVSVPNDINSFYSGQNLGFSFCTGSVQLP